jgi:putative membrane protein insertion efficiency factor
MIKNNILVFFSIHCIKKIWHGRLGRKYNNKKGILCRFYPSCSNYAILALEKYGFFKGWYLAYRRIKRCNQSNTDSSIDYP